MQISSCVGFLSVFIEILWLFCTKFELNSLSYNDWKLSFVQGLPTRSGSWFMKFRLLVREIFTIAFSITRLSTHMAAQSCLHILVLIIIMLFTTTIVEPVFPNFFNSYVCKTDILTYNRQLLTWFAVI